MLNDLDRKLASEHYRRLQREARIERIFASESRKAGLWQHLAGRLGDLLIRMGLLLKQGARRRALLQAKAVAHEA